ncbi:MAG: lamin tail domain-containing protein [Candidatus Eisenbacteria bacterium]|uniref:Lamin tail domain-containing protein n=1 Tax=Eiseniibacteriota bacterium TaxID=2212470 RepID=A0A956RNS1_UNCEI|nr:lamin tail domain-containing protein [Candidatus Eisenbacteria bacterium]
MDTRKRCSRPAPSGLAGEAEARFRFILAPALGVVVGLWGSFPLPAGAALVINEVVYDPDGPDSGREWVELYNSGTWPAPLEGVRIESGNGSAPDQWSLEWEGGPHDWIEPRGWFVVGDSTFAHAPASLSLQNGPDGVRLSREGLVLDTVGWGDLEIAEYFEGSPTPETNKSESLSRSADGFDTDDNGADFLGAVPTPGRANRPAVDLAIDIVGPDRLLPVAAWPGSELRVPVRFTNRGSDVLDLLAVAVRVGGNRTSGLRGLLAPASARLDTFSIAIPERPQVAGIGVHATLAEDGNPDNDRDSLRISIGRGPLSLAEVLPRPSDGEEWIELSADVEVSVDGWSLEDASGSRLVLSATTVPAKAHVLLSASHAPGTLDWSGAWPSLNDRAGGGVSADSLFLRDEGGVVRDWMAYGFAELDRSWVRLDPSVFGGGAWMLDPHPGGTPGVAGDAVPPAVESRERIVPSGFSLERSPAGTWIRVSTEHAPLDFQVRVFDLMGRPIWSTHGRARNRTEERCRWDGRGPDGRLVPQGVYFIETERDWGSGRDRSRQSVVVGR